MDCTVVGNVSWTLQVRLFSPSSAACKLHSSNSGWSACLFYREEDEVLNGRDGRGINQVFSHKRDTRESLSAEAETGCLGSPSADCQQTGGSNLRQEQIETVAAGCVWIGRV